MCSQDSVTLYMFFFFFKQKTAYEMRISDWSSDVCSSDLKDYPKAIKRLEAARAAGSTEPNVPILLMDSYLNAGQVDQGLATAKAAIEASRAAGQRPSDELYVRPIKALQADRKSTRLNSSH